VWRAGTAAQNWGEAPAPQAQCATPLGLSLSEGLGRTRARLIVFYMRAWPYHYAPRLEVEQGEIFQAVPTPGCPITANSVNARFVTRISTVPTALAMSFAASSIDRSPPILRETRTTTSEPEKCVRRNDSMRLVSVVSPCVRTVHSCSTATKTGNLTRMRS
jgi:hypothetical protein